MSLHWTKRPKPPPGMKYCGGCEGFRDLSAFTSNKTARDGLAYRCRDCHAKAHQTTKATHNALMRDWYRRNRDKHLAAGRAWAKQNRERVREIWRRHDRSGRKKRYPDAVRAAVKRWNERHPERRAAIWRASRIRRDYQKQASVVTPAEWRQIREVFGERCAYCLRRGVRLTQDHVVPLSRGGEHVAHNIVPACQPCNSRKNNRPIWAMLKAR